MSESKREACAAVSEHLVAYVDDELAGESREVVVTHIATCLSCRREIQSIEQVGALLTALPRIEPSVDLAERLQDRMAATSVIDTGSARTTGRRLPGTPGWAVAFAAAAAVALALSSVLNHGTVSPSRTESVEVAAPSAVSAPMAVSPPRAIAAAQRAARVAVADARGADELMPEDLPPDLLERPELYLRLPVVHRLQTLEHFEAVRADGDQDRIGRGPCLDRERAAWA